MDRALEQHQAYRELLQQLGCAVVLLPPLDDLPDAVFVEDVAVVLDEVAVMAPMSAPSRQAESAPMAELLAGYRTLLHLTPPATLDGGDVLRIGRTLYVGRSGRTNGEAIRQLHCLLEACDYSVIDLEIRNCLHLKTACSYLGHNMVLANPGWVDVSKLAPFRVMAVDPAEPWGANTLRVDNTIVYPASFPRTAQQLAKAGFDVRCVDLGELQKAEAGPSCLAISIPSANRQWESCPSQ